VIFLFFYFFFFNVINDLGLLNLATGQLFYWVNETMEERKLCGECVYATNFLLPVICSYRLLVSDFEM